MKKIDVHAAKVQLSKLLERAHRGEVLVICKDGCLRAAAHMSA